MISELCCLTEILLCHSNLQLPGERGDLLTKKARSTRYEILVVQSCKASKDSGRKK